MKVLDRYKEPVHNIARTKAGDYTGAELQPYIGRPEAAQTLALPSRVGQRLTYRDGRVTALDGTPIAPLAQPTGVAGAGALKGGAL